eukprot:CAMPEP_0177702132 /NCGR_PEP_ID=MMETSP0484_2-20121128/6978_1 /TAXON_ID=354590 /ORGANISM="Rhodomonas lens, Strain RHODO" /LENGTH=846 /DNA_ID=CAMNT_0019213405 /DNA_START=305 /DNA_END=2842 /DNA_ORIENTATION=+
MDRATGLTDAYVKPQLKGVAFDPQQTSIQRKTLNPVWDQHCKCDVTDDCLLQDEPLQLRVFDYDVLSADDVIGTVYVHLNSLYEGVDRQQRRTEEGGQKQKKKISGWFPIYDTLRGICGELQVTVYIAHIMDHNPVEDSSVGVQVLSASTPPDSYTITECLGLVDELLVEDDPEYNWQDTFRSSRSSNDARQLLFHSMDGKLRRQIGRKVTDCGGNALLGYQTHFDLENNFIIARGIGTAVSLERNAPGLDAGSGSAERDGGPLMIQRHLSKSIETEPEGAEGSSESVPSSGAPSGHLGPMRGDGEAILEPLRELEPLTQAQLRTLQRSKRDKRERYRANLRQEILLFSMQEFSPGVIVVLGGMVAARSVKVIGQEGGKQERVVEVRDAWWNELRAEIKTHARSLDCCHVIGYSETATISEDGVCVLSASGTAAILDQAGSGLRRSHSVTPMQAGMPGAASPTTDQASNGNGAAKIRSKREAISKCGLCHIPYSHRSPPFSMRLVLCSCCGSKYVPDVLLATVEVPEETGIQGQGQLLEVHVCRVRQASKNLNGVEYNATRISELMPFMEYDLHKQIMSKLKIRSHNAVFGLRTVLCIGESMVTCVATGTSVLLSALPIPQPLEFMRTDVRTDAYQTSHHVRMLMNQSNDNRQAAQKARDEANEQAALTRDCADDSSSDSSTSSSSDSEDGGNKPAYVLEIDDDQGERDLIALWEEPLACVEGVCSTGRMPFADDNVPRAMSNIQLLTLFRRVTLTHPKEFGGCLAKLYQEVLLSLCLRLRSLSKSLVLCGLKTHISLHEDSTLQLGIVTMSQVRSEPRADDSSSSPKAEDGTVPRSGEEAGSEGA